MTVTVLEVGPTTVRRLCAPNAAARADTETIQTALEALDDPLALVDDEPVCVDRLWRTVMRSLCARRPGHPPEPVMIVSPSWWAPSRTRRVIAAAHAVAGDVATRRRSWLLATAAPEPNVVVEITERLVVITGDVVAAEARTGQPVDVATAVTGHVVAMTAGAPGRVVIDAPGTARGAAALAATLGDRLRSADADLAVEVVDDDRLHHLASAVFCTREQQRPAPTAEITGRQKSLSRNVLPVVSVVSAVLLCAVATSGRRDAPAPEEMSTTFLVEGRVTLEVPAQWPVQRVTSGPGSARVVLTSPSNPHVALHVTQSQVPDEALDATADALARAITAEPAGVFVEFNPAGQRAGRPAVTYRERRPGHDIEWTILLAEAVRIGIGCQSPPSDHDTVGEVCERAVGSARRLG